jgi:predicted ATPase
LDNNRFLYADAGNLAAILHLLHETKSSHYDRIVATIQQIAPFFGGFALEPHALNPRYTSLRWRERGSEYEFGPHQLSDGTLRAMALITLLLQPEELLPAMILLDEPELGLHPSAVAVVCTLIRQASSSSQIIIATQSPFMLDQFDADDVIVVERGFDDGRRASSVFRRLDAAELAQWMEEFTLGELWERNVLGGRPTR